MYMKRRNIASQTQNINEESKGFISELKDKDKPMLGETKLSKSSQNERNAPTRTNGTNRNERGSNH
jgi:hypothetical protein